MESKSYFYVPFSKKTDFNAAVGHCQAVLNVLGAKPTDNIADIINEMVIKKEIVADEVLPITSVVLLDKLQYKCASVNLDAVPKDSKALIDEISTWHGIDVVLGYQHPELGFLLLNPKNPANASIIDGFRKNEMLRIYVGKDGEVDSKLADSATNAVLSLLYDGKKTSLPSAVKSGSYVFRGKAAPKPAVKKTPAKKAAPKKTAAKRIPQTTYVQETASSDYNVPDYLKHDTAPARPIGNKNMSPLVSVLVTNELFHNGNVEAWKRIIRAYNAKYPNAEVMVFYDGERIIDINTLFKWGKVKHGTMIQFAVADEKISDLSKLRKYLTQGASPAFGAFLKGSPDTVLNLF